MTTRRDLVVPAALLLGSLAACRREQKKVIAVIPKATSHLFWLSVQAGAYAAGKEFGVEILWNGPAQETDYSRQIQIVDSMVARRVDGIALAAAERKALVASVERATSMGIPVSVFDSGLDSEAYMSYIATDNFKAGQLAGRTLAALIGGKGSVGIVAHAPGSFSTMERERGLKDVLAREFPSIRIVAEQFGMSDRAKSMAAAENILTANAQLDGLFASSEPSAMGTALALKSRARTGAVKFVAFDSSDSMIEDLRGGTIQALVVQDPFRMGHDAVAAIVDKLAGRTPARRIDLDARVVTAADLAKPDIIRLLKPELKKE